MHSRRRGSGGCVCCRAWPQRLSPTSSLAGRLLPTRFHCSECGLNVELEDVPVQSLVPEPLRDLKTGDEYMQARCSCSYSCS